MTENEKKVLDGFNNTDVFFQDCLIQEHFEKYADVRPDKIAVICGEKCLTYKELNSDSNRLAQHLLARNIFPGDIVGISLERSVTMVVSVLAVLKAGCCYLPLDPSFPDERINFMLENSGAKSLICHDYLKMRYQNFLKSYVDIIDLENCLSDNFSNVKPNLTINPQSYAYLLYTSGSTGIPKGVRIHHQAVVNFLNSMIHAPGISEDDILLAVTTLSFDISVLEIFLPLSVGATIVVADNRDTNDGNALIDLIEKHNITFLQATPSHWFFLLASEWKGKKDLKAICGGETLSSNLVREVLPKVSELWNFYGPTETTVWSTGLKIIDHDAPVLIGKPIDNTKIYILDRNNLLLSAGEIGEICIGGLGVAKGYYRSPDITAKKFISFEDKGIIYKTGDIGRFLNDGNLEYLGRIDSQIKLKGYRIEPVEIESSLTRLPGVCEAVVIHHKFEDNDECLVAFLNVVTGFNLSKIEIINSLSLMLPKYMIPRFFQMSEKFPRLPNGKINKNALSFEINNVEGNWNHEINSNIETKLYKIWYEVLKTKEISANDNFFEIGGNSLLAISAFSKIKDTFNLELDLRVFFEGPRILDLVDIIDIALRNEKNRIKNNTTEKHNSKIVKGEI